MLDSEEDTEAEGRWMSEIGQALHTPMQDHPSSPTRLTRHLYLGNYSDSAHFTILHRLGITHVLNCAALTHVDTNPYPERAGVQAYLQFQAVDSPGYDILQHLPQAQQFIDRAIQGGGKVLVHCVAGVNRSGALCTAYLMLNRGWDLIHTLTFIKAKRPLLLSNRSFRRQLLYFASERQLLERQGLMGEGKWRTVARRASQYFSCGLIPESWYSLKDR